MKKIILLNCFIVGLLFVLFFSTQKIFAQTASSAKTPDQIAKEKGITFPIAELGNCKDYTECRTFCDDPLNKDACIAFAKKKGFYKEVQVNSQKSEILNAAKTELGCDSPSSCQAFCSKGENHDKCETFAKSHNLGGGQTVDPTKSQILEKAKSILGCDSPSSCKTFCEQEQNRTKCSEFAKGVGLRGGETKTGPGGCTSEETCRKFCSDPNNFEICQKFQGSVTGKPESFHGPGGCNTPESCKAYCEKNPQDCQNIGGTTKFDPQDVCSKTPNCSWTGTTCQCTSFNGPSKAFPATSSENISPQDYCRQYPERCKFQSSYPSYSPNPSYSPYPTGETGGYNYPSSSPYSGGGLQDYSSQCTKTPGCTWTGTTCQCSGTSGSTTFTTPVPTSGTTTSTPPPTTISTTSPTYDPATQCAKTAGCAWTGSTCICKSVQGASTQRSFFQTVLETLFRL